MRSRFDWGSTSSWLKVLLIIALLLGLFFRFTDLDKKVYWHDEAYTSLWISGYSPEEVNDGILTGKIISADNIQKYQNLDPESSVFKTVRLLAMYDPQHPPLYYSIVRLWVGAFGDSVDSIRRVSALLSLLSLPFAYWLGIELFNSPQNTWILVGLTAISPLQILYAQEAREYGLWIAMIFFSSAAFLKAIKRPSKLNWLVYAVSLIMSLYTFLFTVFIMGAHGTYLLVTQQFRLTKALLSYMTATVVSLLMFMPWFIILWTNSSTIISAMSWTAVPTPVTALSRSWMVNTSRIILDFNLKAQDPFLITVPVIGFTLILTTYALVFLYRNSPRYIWLFIFLLGSFTALALIIPDLLLGGQRSTQNRYLIPTWLSIQLVFSYWLKSLLMPNSSLDVANNSLKQKISRISFAILFSLVLTSDIILLKSDASWMKSISYYHPTTANIVNQSNQLLLIGDSSSGNFLGQLLSLSHRLDPKIKLLILTKPELPQIPDRFNDIFLYNPSSNLRENIEAIGHSVELVYTEGNLWRFIE